MEIASHSWTPDNKRTITFCIRHMGPNEDLDECDDVQAVRTAFLNFVRSQLNRGKMTEQQTERAISTIRSQAKGRLLRLFASHHPWVKNLEVHIG